MLPLFWPWKIKFIHYLASALGQLSTSRFIHPVGLLSTVQRSPNDWNSTPRLVMRVDPYTLLGKSLPVPPNWGKYSTTNIGQIIIHQFILEMWKHFHDGCVIIVTNDSAQWSRLLLEWIHWSDFSMQSLLVSLLVWLIVGPHRVRISQPKSENPFGFKRWNFARIHGFSLYNYVWNTTEIFMRIHLDFILAVLLMRIFVRMDSWTFTEFLTLTSQSQETGGQSTRFREGKTKPSPLRIIWHYIPAKRQWQHSGISILFWSPERFHGQVSGMAVSWSTVLCSSGNVWFLEELLYRACNDVASLRPLLMVHSYVLLWLQVVYVVPFHQWTYELSAWYEPFYYLLFTAMEKGKKYMISINWRVMNTKNSNRLQNIPKTPISLSYLHCEIPRIYPAFSFVKTTHFRVRVRSTVRIMPVPTMEKIYV